MSIVFVSSELEEVAGISDRIWVLDRGWSQPRYPGRKGSRPPRS